MTPARARSPAAGGLAPAYAAFRARLGLVALLFAPAAAGWWWTGRQMSGMDQGPWTALGTLGWFLGVWVVMTAAMMFPSVAPTVALYSRVTRQRSRVSPWAFVAGYLATWAGAGLVAFAVLMLVERVAGDVLAWDRAGRWVAGGTLVVAALYELSPLKDVCLGRCRSPLGQLLASWRDGAVGAVRMGMRNGAWCVGCCWALMASLFALGVMSIVWMGVVAGLIAVEKTLPWKPLATYGVAALLLALGVVVLLAPHAVPALTVPVDGSVPDMAPMGSWPRLPEFLHLFRLVG